MAASLYIQYALAAVALLATAGFMTERQMRDESPALGAAAAADTATIMGVMSSYEAALNRDSARNGPLLLASIHA